MKTGRYPAAVPLVAVDEVTVGPDAEAAGRKAIRATDPYLPGHYPGAVIYPGVFVIESACQVVARWVAAGYGAARATLAAVDSVRFLAPLRPGDELRLAATCTVRAGQLHARVRGVDQAGRPVASMALRFTVTGEAGDE